MLAVEIDLFAVTVLLDGLVGYKYLINWNLKNTRLCWGFADLITYRVDLLMLSLILGPIL